MEGLINITQANSSRYYFKPRVDGSTNFGEISSADVNIVTNIKILFKLNV